MTIIFFRRIFLLKRMSIFSQFLAFLLLIMRLSPLVVRISRFALLNKPPVVARHVQITQLQRSFHTEISSVSSFLLAGHSHWHNIKATKEAKDKVKCNVISQYIGKIRKMIAATGNPDPKTSSDLAKLIEEARARDVPKDSIDKALKNSLRGAGGKVVLLEARGPGGVSLILECLTDKLARLRSEVGWILKKNGGQFADANSIKHQFMEKGTIDAPLPANIKPEQVEDFAIEAEAEEFNIDNDTNPPMVHFICEAAEVYKVLNALKSKGFDKADGQVEFLPQVMRPIDEATGQQLDKLLSAVEEHVEVLRVFNNASMDEPEAQERRKN